MARMKIALGAPVAERAWILPDWFEALSKQTVQPDYFCFVYSESQDETLQLLTDLLPEGADLEIFASSLPFYSREQRGADPKDPWRAHHMARLRNKLRYLFLRTDADVFVSLDTDILLQDPQTLEKLLATLEGNYALASPLVNLHARDDLLCANAGFWVDRRYDDFKQAWQRCDENTVAAYRSPVQIEVPMAAFAIKRFAMGMCRYRAHELGEDLGFAQSLSQHGFRCAWLPELKTRHVWGKAWL